MTEEQPNRRFQCQRNFVETPWAKGAAVEHVECMLFSRASPKTRTRNIERYETFESIFGRYGTFQLSNGAICRHYTHDRIHALFSDYERLESADVQIETMNGSRAVATQLSLQKRAMR